MESEVKMINVPMEKIYKNSDIKLLIISYRFKDKSIAGARLGPKIKNFYENNSRGLVTMNITYFTAVFNSNFGYTAENVKEASNQANRKFGKGNFDMYLHVCNPKISTSGSNTAKTYNSATNAIHEVGHLFKFGHAHVMQYPDLTKPIKKKTGKGRNIDPTKPVVIYSKDPFDAIVVTAPYPVLNPPHRFSHGWYLPGEIVYVQNDGIYDLYSLKNMRDKTNVKTLGHRNSNNQLYFVSYGTKKDRKTKIVKNQLIFHFTDSLYQYSFMDGYYATENRQSLYHQRSGITINILKQDNNKITIKMSIEQSEQTAKIMEVEDEIGDSKDCEDCEDCECEKCDCQDCECENCDCEDCKCGHD